MDRALFAARQLISPDAAHEIATAPDGIAALAFARARLARFEARGCRQLIETDWQAETVEVAGEVEAKLARRYRDHFK